MGAAQHQRVGAGRQHRRQIAVQQRARGLVAQRPALDLFDQAGARLQHHARPAAVQRAQPRHRRALDRTARGENADHP